MAEEIQKQKRRKSRHKGKTPLEHDPIPLVHRLAWSVDQLSILSSLGRTTLYDLMNRDLLEYYKAGARRFVTAEAWRECCKRLEQLKESK